MKELFFRCAGALAWGAILLTSISVVFLIYCGVMTIFAGLGLFLIDSVCGTAYLSVQLAVTIAVVITLIRMMFGMKVEAK